MDKLSPLQQWVEDGDPDLSEAYRNVNRWIVVCFILTVFFVYWLLVS